MIVTDRSNLVDQMEASVVDFSQTICRVSSSPVAQAEDLAMEEAVDMIIFDIRPHEADGISIIFSRFLRRPSKTRNDQTLRRHTPNSWDKTGRPGDRPSGKKRTPTK